MSDLSDHIEQIKARLERATPGPWEVFEHRDHSGLEAGPPHTEEYLRGYVNRVCGDSEWMRRGVTEQQRNDFRFIANAPSDIEFLLAEVERLRIENQGLNDSLVLSLADSFDRILGS